MRLVRYGWLAMTVLVLALALLADGATFTTVHHTCSPNNCSGLELTRQQVNEMYGAMLLVPLSIGVAVLRYRL